MPKLQAHLAAEGLHSSMFATQWFITLFAYSLPFDVVLRIWDVLMLEGTKALFRVSLALLSTQQDALVKLPFEELVPALRRAPAPGKAAADALLKVAMELKVSKKLEELKQAYQAEQAKGRGGGAPGATPQKAAAPAPAAAEAAPSGRRWGRGKK
jgi:hypothetical protein